MAASYRPGANRFAQDAALRRLQQPTQAPAAMPERPVPPAPPPAPMQPPAQAGVSQPPGQQGAPPGAAAVARPPANYLQKPTGPIWGRLPGGGLPPVQSFKGTQEARAPAADPQAYTDPEAARRMPAQANPGAAPIPRPTPARPVTGNAAFDYFMRNRATSRR